MFGEISGAHRVLPAPIYGQSVFSPGGGNVDLSGLAQGVYGYTGFSMPLPSAGVYLVGYNVRGNVSVNKQCIAFIVVSLHKNDTGTDVEVPNSNRQVCIVDSTGSTSLENAMFQHESGYNCIVTVNAACSILLYAKWDGTTSPTFNFVQIVSDFNGYTMMNYWKIA